MSSTTERAPLGLKDLSALPGNHIAHFYQTIDEWRDVLVTYHQEGIEAGDKCVYLMKSDRKAAWLDALAASGVDVDRALASDQLVIIEDNDDVSERQEALAGVLDQIGKKYPMLRSGGDVNETATHWDWEAHIMDVANERAVFLCQYDVSAFHGDVVMDALRTHPICVVSNAVVRNPFHEKPEVFRERLRERPARFTAATTGP